MAYIKSHSNYVLHSKHKSLDNGVILERDYTTIGGVDSFSKGQTPIYRSGNFIVTINTESVSNKVKGSSKWKENPRGEVWTLSDVENISELPNDENSKIVLKNDYYSLHDFAYYGSCSELIRGSINDIVLRYPYELYVTNSCSEYNELNKELDKYSNEGNYVYVQNPANVDIITTYVNESSVDNPLLFLSVDGYWQNYEIIDNSGNSNPISSVTVKEYDTTGDIFTTAHTSCLVYKVTINETITLYAAKVHKSTQIFCDVNDNWQGFHIRPKKEFLDKFYNTLDSFQKILMNPTTEPIYTASFDVWYDDESNGLRHVIEDFSFPFGDGGYNIGTNKMTFSEYLGKLLGISEFYDLKFSDNLYRMMTHESIKNFDWTYDKVNDNAEQYEEGTQKIAQLIRLFGREFDELKMYIDNITNYNCISYDDRSNLPAYFLTDELQNDGIDVINIYPYEIYEKQLNTTTCKWESCEVTTGDAALDLISINHIRGFNQDIEKTIAPYDNCLLYPYGYFIKCIDGKYTKIEAEEYEKILIDYEVQDNYIKLKNRYRKYSSKRQYTYKDINLEFFKRLKLNSKHILRQKGTIHGIEMILGLLGLKSKKYIESFRNSNYKNTELFNANQNQYDYDIKEFVSFTNGIDDLFWDCKMNNHINWYNSTKALQYHDNDKNYKGLPVAYRYKWQNNNGDYLRDIQDVIDYDINTLTLQYLSTDNKVKTSSPVYKVMTIYPNFEPYSEIDGDLYYQMNGGWRNTKPYTYDKDNNIVKGDDVFVETLNCVKVVNSMTDLIAVNTNDLVNGQPYYVKDIRGKYILLNGYLYKVETDTRNHKYINIPIIDTTITIGGEIVYGKFLSYYPYIIQDNNEEVLKEYDLTLLNGEGNVRIYLTDDNKVKIKQNLDYEDNTYDGYAVTINSQKYIDNGIFMDNISETNKTNYFKLVNKNYKEVIGYNGIFNDDETIGWKQLTKTDLDYKKINILTNYKKGNNQHSGNLIYDNGLAYMNYFANLFNYSIENDLFDYRLFRGTYYDELDNIKQIGFKNLLNENKTDYKAYEDSKIHYFGNYFDIKSSNASITTNKYNINNMESWYDYKDYKDININPLNQTVPNVCKGSELDGSTYQIVNTKKVVVTFYLSDSSTNNNLLDKNSMEEMKYFEDIVVPYMTQMIPSTTILEIHYEKR